MLFKNDKGFSLVNVMIAASIAGGLALGVMRLSQTSNNVTRKMTADIELGSTLGLISQVLKSKEACTATFEGVDPRGTGDLTKTVIYHSEPAIPDNEKFRVGQNIAGAIRLLTFRVYGFSEIPSSSSPPSKSGDARLGIEFERIGIKGGGSKVWKAVAVNVTIGADNKITECAINTSLDDPDQYYVVVSNSTAGYGGCAASDTAEAYSTAGAGCAAPSGNCTDCSNIARTGWEAVPPRHVCYPSHRVWPNWEPARCDADAVCNSQKFTLCKVGPGAIP